MTLINAGSHFRQPLLSVFELTITGRPAPGVLVYGRNAQAADYIY